MTHRLSSKAMAAVLQMMPIIGFVSQAIPLLVYQTRRPLQWVADRHYGELSKTLDSNLVLLYIIAFKRLDGV